MLMTSPTRAMSNSPRRPEGSWQLLHPPTHLARRTRPSTLPAPRDRLRSPTTATTGRLSMLLPLREGVIPSVTAISLPADGYVEPAVQAFPKRLTVCRPTHNTALGASIWAIYLMYKPLEPVPPLPWQRE